MSKKDNNSPIHMPPNMCLNVYNCFLMFAKSGVNISLLLALWNMGKKKETIKKKNLRKETKPRIMKNEYNNEN